MHCRKPQVHIYTAVVTFASGYRKGWIHHEICILAFKEEDHTVRTCPTSLCLALWLQMNYTGVYFQIQMKQAGLQGGTKHGKVKMKNKCNNQQSQSANEPWIYAGEKTWMLHKLLAGKGKPTGNKDGGSWHLHSAFMIFYLPISK